LSEKENQLKKQIDGITRYLDTILVLLAEIITKERLCKYYEEEINAVTNKAI
jgi:predicted metalloprotease with PDZ domain